MDVGRGGDNGANCLYLVPSVRRGGDNGASFW
jgi:hypothetical protein